MFTLEISDKLQLVVLPEIVLLDRTTGYADRTPGYVFVTGTELIFDVFKLTIHR
jgi:hypothetical protein